jgi:RNAse (barnase) inhibitor barstar
MASLLELLPDSERAGVFESSLDPDEITAAAKTVGLQVFKLDLRRTSGKLKFLEQIAKTFRFPSYFGKNWDALNDCITDLSWLDGAGWVLLLTHCRDFAAEHEDSFTTALTLLSSTAKHWRTRRKPFWVFVQSQSGWDSGLPEIVSD